MKPLLSRIVPGPVALAMSLLLAGVLAAPASPAEDDPNASPLPAEVTQAQEGTKQPAAPEEEQNCTWSCLRWDKLCNVDPRRGTYDCRRMCAEFGEVCE